MIENFVSILNTSAPWLLIGFLVGGIVHSLLPTSVIGKFLSKNKFRSCLNASLIGLPLPLCSCSVLPVAASLRKQGASKGAVSSFLVSTPEVGVDSAMLSYALFGLPFTIFRVVASAFTAMVTGLLVTKYQTEQEVPEPEVNCCCDKREPILRYAFLTLPTELVNSLAFGFLLAAIIPSLFGDQLHLFSSSSELLQLFIALAVSFPVYVCSVGATPLAASLLLEGVSPGAVLVFLLAGPATNIATVLVARDLLGYKEAMIYVFSVAICSLVMGFLFSSVMSVQGLSPLSHADCAGSLTFWSYALLALMFTGFYRRIRA